MNDVSFKISTGLKDIIGRELITDDFIAVFELVKNAFDAGASKVEVIFENLRTSEPSITIKDDGSGMNIDDIKNKWLFVAYSAKKSDADYRNQIKTERIFAGAKGIGRFSCDRLGAKLRLTTKKKEANSLCYRLNVDWTLFEKHPEDEFHTIPAQLNELSDLPFNEKESGTILEITELRGDDWSRDKLLRLRKSLEKLINPNQGNDSHNFSIEITAPDEEVEDNTFLAKKPPELWDVVNGPIQNFIFEALEVKTTQIYLEIDESGEELRTRLNDRGTLIYELLEHNPFPEHLHNVKITLFYMDPSAKSTFTRRMGLQPVKFGSVFLYKNGFRIHPYGDSQNDGLGIDRRKQQGHYRFLGSRELLGRIEINGSNPQFQETTSRDGGLIQNSAFENLRRLLFSYALRRLESYVVDLRKFGKGLDEIPDIKDPNSKKLRDITFNIISNLIKSEDAIAIDYDPEVFNLLENRQSNSLNALLGNLKRISAKQNDPKFHDEIAKAEKQIAILQKAREEAEHETEIERERVRQAEEEAKKSVEIAQIAQEKAHLAQAEVQIVQEQVTKSEEKSKILNTQNLFLKSVMSRDLTHVVELHHSIGQDARTIEQFATYLLGIISNKNRTLNPDVIQSTLEKINFVARKITTVSRFATQANFQVDVEEITADLVTYIREYLLNVYEGFVLDSYGQKIDIIFNELRGKEFVIQFMPINVSIVLDNLISNSCKHKSKQIVVSVIGQDDTKLVISLRDNGNGVPQKIIPYIFDIGFTTTDGSGLGLHHSFTIMTEMQGTISFNQEFVDGTEFILTFNKH